MWLVVTILDRTDTEHFCYLIKFSWAVLAHSITIASLFPKLCGFSDKANPTISYLFLSAKIIYSKG